jgi:hypothetical protein
MEVRVFEWSLKSVSNRSVWNFHYNLFFGTFRLLNFQIYRRHTEVPQVKISICFSLYF